MGHKKETPIDFNNRYLSQRLIVQRNIVWFWFFCLQKLSEQLKDSEIGKHN